MPIQTINNFIPPAAASPYNPATTITVPKSDSKKFTLVGRGADVFGLNRILPWCSSMGDITMKAMLNNDRLLFEDIQLSAIRQLFENGELLAPYIIQKNNNLEITLTNNDTVNDIEVNVQLLGYDGPTLRKLISDYNTAGLSMPTPIFLYGNASVLANAKRQRIDIPTKAVDVILNRMAIRTDSDDDIRVSLQIYNETVKNGVFVQQINDEFALQRTIVPYIIGKNVPFNLEATSTSGNNQTLSFLGEAYVQQ